MTAFSLSKPPVKKQSGFTLIEITVAVIIMAILALISFRGLTSMIQARDHLTEQTRRWYNVSVFFSRLENDLFQLRERSVRGRNGETMAAFIGKPDFIYTGSESDEDAQLIFTRGGVPDQVGFAADMKRVGYRYRDGKIEMLLWPALDLAPDSFPLVEPVLEGVRGMTIRYRTNRHGWVNYWPDARDLSPSPRGLEIVIELDSGETIRRMIALKQGVAY